MPENKREGPRRHPSGVNLMTNTCLLCTVHSYVSHLWCPGAADLMGSSGVKGTCPDVWGSIWAEEAFTKPLSVHSERRGQVLFNHTDWLPVVMRVPGAKLPLRQCSPNARAHSLVTKYLFQYLYCIRLQCMGFVPSMKPLPHQDSNRKQH